MLTFMSTPFFIDGQVMKYGYYNDLPITWIMEEAFYNTSFPSKIYPTHLKHFPMREKYLTESTSGETFISQLENWSFHPFFSASYTSPSNQLLRNTNRTNSSVNYLGKSETKYLQYGYYKVNSLSTYLQPNFTDVISTSFTGVRDNYDTSIITSSSNYLYEYTDKEGSIYSDTTFQGTLQEVTNRKCWYECKQTDLVNGVANNFRNWVWQDENISPPAGYPSSFPFGFPIYQTSQTIRGNYFYFVKIEDEKLALIGLEGASFDAEWTNYSYFQIYYEASIEKYVLGRYPFSENFNHPAPYNQVYASDDLNLDGITTFTSISDNENYDGVTIDLSIASDVVFNKLIAKYTPYNYLNLHSCAYSTFLTDRVTYPFSTKGTEYFYATLPIEGN